MHPTVLRKRYSLRGNRYEKNFITHFSFRLRALLCGTDFEKDLYYVVVEMTLDDSEPIYVALAYFEKTFALANKSSITYDLSTPNEDDTDSKELIMHLGNSVKENGAKLSKEDIKRINDTYMGEEIVEVENQFEAEK